MWCCISYDRSIYSSISGRTNRVAAFSPGGLVSDLGPSNLSHSADTLPRLAQWESQLRKYYYVQRATGVSQWEIPTQPAHAVPTPDPTPQQSTNPFQQPSRSAASPGPHGEATRGEGGVDPKYQGADRSLLSVRRLGQVRRLSILC